VVEISIINLPHLGVISFGLGIVLNRNYGSHLVALAN